MQTFNELQQQAEQALSQRENQLENLYLQAMQHFQTAAASAYENKLALENAFKTFGQMILLDPEDYRAFLFTGYLLLLMDDLEEAEAYLLAAQERQPEEADIAFLLQALNKQKDQPRFSHYDPELPPEQQSADPDLLFTEVENFVHKRLRQLLALKAQGQDFIVDNDVYKALKSSLVDLQLSLNQLEGPLCYLGSLFEQNDIEALMLPLLQQQQKLSAVYELSARFISLKRELSHNTKAVSEQVKRVRLLKSSDEIRAFDQQLDQVYSDCEQFADRLDALEAEGHDITALEKAYERLVSFVNQLQMAFEQRFGSVKA